MQTEQDNALDASKIQFISRKDSVFLTTILFSLRFSWDETVKTACTNGIELKINPIYFLSLDKEERIFLLAHECYHVAFQHMLRVENRNFKLWNIATDYVINIMLVDAGMKINPHWLFDEKYRGLSSEEVYAILEKEPDNWPDDPEHFTEPDDDTELERIEREVADTIIRAAMAAKSSNQLGTIPGEIELFLDKMLKPKLPWHRILYNILSEYDQTDYSYRRPNRRYLPDYYLPTLYSESMGEFAVAVDISGSAVPHFKQFISEIYAIHTKLCPTATRVISFDTVIQNEYTIEEAKDIVGLTLTGGGGTDVTPVFEWTKENKPKTLIIFTDGAFDLENRLIPKGIPVFWIIVGKYPFEPKRGKVIRFE